jgi:hypothetical protein
LLHHKAGARYRAGQPWNREQGIGARRSRGSLHAIFCVVRQLPARANDLRNEVEQSSRVTTHDGRRGLWLNSAR